MGDLIIRCLIWKILRGVNQLISKAIDLNLIFQASNVVHDVMLFKANNHSLYIVEWDLKWCGTMFIFQWMKNQILMVKGIHLILKAYEENLIYFWDLVFQEFNNVQWHHII